MLDTIDDISQSLVNEPTLSKLFICCNTDVFGDKPWNNACAFVILDWLDGNVTFTTLTEAGSTSDFETNGLLDGKVIYGRFETCEVDSGTLTAHLY